MNEPDIRCDFMLPYGCEAQATVVAFWNASRLGAKIGGRAYCPKHAAPAALETGQFRPDRVEPIIRSPLPVSLFLAGLSGWLPPLGVELVDAYIADPAASAPLLDFSEDRASGWARVAVEWPTRDAHGTGDNPHVWMAYGRGDEHRADRAPWGDRKLAKRCPCGMFEHEDRRLDLEHELRLAQGEYMIARNPASLDEEPDEANLERLRARCVALSREIQAQP
jgi:hypothetical protein